MSIVTGLTAARMLAIEAASVVSGAISGDNLILTKHDGSTINAGNVRGPKGDNANSRNRIINGDFSVNQRAFTSTTVDGTYGHDRWKLAASGGTCTYSAQTVAEAAISSETLNISRLVTSGHSAAGDFAALKQPIENVRVLAGKTVTVSFWARASSGTPKVAATLYQNFGSGGSSAVITHVGKPTLSTTWTRYSVSISLPSMSGKTVGTSSSLDLYLFTSAGTNFNSWTNSLGVQNTTIEFWGVQVEDSPVVTAFDQKPYADQLRDCHRYYWKMVGVGYIPSINDATNRALTVYSCPVSMRVTPTVTISGPVYILEPGFNIFPVTSISNQTLLQNNVGSFSTGVSGGGLTINRASFLYLQDGTSKIEFNAEL